MGWRCPVSTITYKQQLHMLAELHLSYYQQQITNLLLYYYVLASKHDTELNTATVYIRNFSVSPHWPILFSVLHRLTVGAVRIPILFPSRDSELRLPTTMEIPRPTADETRTDWRQSTTTTRTMTTTTTTTTQTETTNTDNYITYTLTPYKT